MSENGGRDSTLQMFFILKKDSCKFYTQSSDALPSITCVGYMFIPWYPINHNFASSIPIISDYPLTDALPQKKQVSESSPRSWEACGIFATQSVYLVGGFNPSEKYESQLGLLFPIYGKIKNVPNHFVPLCATHCLGSRRQHSCLWDTLR